MDSGEGSGKVKRLSPNSTSSSYETDESVSSSEERMLGKIKDLVRQTLGKYRGMCDKGKEKVRDVACERRSRILRKYGAAEFTGSGYPVATLVWIQGIEKVFRISKMEDEDKVEFASSMFTEGARIWWDATYKSLSEYIRNEMKWEFFKVLLLDHYCPFDVRMRLEEEFPELRQGPMLSSGHETQTSQKVQSPIKDTTTNEEIIRLCVEDLHKEIRSFMTNYSDPTLGKTDETIEKHVHNLDVHATQIPVPKRPRVDQVDSTSLVQPSQIMLREQPHFQNTPLVNRCCGKNHGGRQKRNHEPVKCHGCGEIGHIRPKCPSKNVKCYDCGTIGHRRRQCSTAPKQSTENKVVVPPLLGASIQVKKEEM